MSLPQPLNQAIIAQALFDLRNGQLRRCRTMGFAEDVLEALKNPTLLSMLTNASVSWCSVSVDYAVLARLLEQAQAVEQERCRRQAARDVQSTSAAHRAFAISH